jgi:drug/metabolite transporter (DMT)-like permease
MENKLFKKYGLIFIPTSFLGLILTLLTVIFCVTVFIAIDRNSHSVSDTLYGFFPFFVSAFTILFWIDGNTSKN